jgi:hypothetical protein
LICSAAPFSRDLAYEWSVDGVRVADQEVTTSPISSLLTVAAMSNSSAGEYRCSVAAGRESASAVTSVAVKGLFF